MRIAAILLTTIFLLNLAKIANASIDNYVKAKATGENASVKVNIKNNVNTGSNTSSYQSETNTKVNISQTGEGTSSVTVNGKEWKLEGPGEINVNESSDSTSSDTQNSEPTNTPAPTSEPEPDVLSDTDENSPTTFSEMIRQKIKDLKESVWALFYKIFNPFK